MSDISQAIENLLGAIYKKVAEEITKAVEKVKVKTQTFELPTLPPNTEGKPKYDPRKPKIKLTPDKMRCRHRDIAGHRRCKERSKGPRFHYLCPKHFL